MFFSIPSQIVNRICDSRDDRDADYEISEEELDYITTLCFYQKVNLKYTELVLKLCEHILASEKNPKYSFHFWDKYLRRCFQQKIHPSQIHTSIENYLSNNVLPSFDGENSPKLLNDTITSTISKQFSLLRSWFQVNSPYPIRLLGYTSLQLIMITSQFSVKFEDQILGSLELLQLLKFKSTTLKHWITIISVGLPLYNCIYGGKYKKIIPNTIRIWKTFAKCKYPKKSIEEEISTKKKKLIQDSNRDVMQYVPSYTQYMSEEAKRRQRNDRSISMFKTHHFPITVPMSSSLTDMVPSSNRQTKRQYSNLSSYSPIQFTQMVDDSFNDDNANNDDDIDDYNDDYNNLDDYDAGGDELSQEEGLKMTKPNRFSRQLTVATKPSNTQNNSDDSDTDEDEESKMKKTDMFSRHSTVTTKTANKLNHFVMEKIEKYVNNNEWLSTNPEFIPLVLAQIYAIRKSIYIDKWDTFVRSINYYLRKRLGEKIRGRSPKQTPLQIVKSGKLKPIINRGILLPNLCFVLFYHKDEIIRALTKFWY